MAQERRANNVIRIPTSLKTSFFRIWIEFLAPLHNLPNRAKDLLAGLLKARFELSESVSDEALLDKLVLGGDTRRAVAKSIGMSEGACHVILNKLKKAGVITNGRINSKFIPKNLSKDDKAFQLLLYLDLDAGSNSKVVL